MGEGFFFFFFFGECGSRKPGNKLQNAGPERGLREAMLQGARDAQVKNFGWHENAFRWPDRICSDTEHWGHGCVNISSA